MIKKYKKKDGTTAYMFVAYLGTDPITGKQKRTTRRGFKTERDAKIAEARLQTEVAQKGFLNNEVTTFKQIYELWLDQYKNTVRESTYINAIKIIKGGVLPYFENVPVKKITVSYCQKVINEWNERIKSVQTYKFYAKQVFDYAVVLKVIADNPFTHTKTPRKTEDNDNETSLYYTSDELKKFLSFTEYKPLYHAIFRTLAFTGMRRGELLALQWQDIDFNNATISINKTWSRLEKGFTIQPPKTKKSMRVISVDSTTIDILKRWKRYQQEQSFKFGHNTMHKTQYVFTNVHNNKVLHLDYLGGIVKILCERHDFKRIKIHGFRHTHCSLLFEAGLSVQDVQDRLGHSDIQTTMNVYAHVTEKQRDNIAEKFAKYINF
ncbi:site-specific integrase [Staphylococcus delphini]|uniref:site-specific integrase n=1 Tax=Staphylococcus delphini TaxID=53344 RepID=UPI000BBCDC8C|nr:site-specific integrase [Staphylococcus delphini]PCF35014.1 site-specific integrase [Staphylococcus delphini]